MAPKPAEEEDWVVEHLLGVKKNLRKKSVEVLIKWKGKPNSKNNWEETSGGNVDSDMLVPFEDAIDALRRNKRTDTDEEYEDKELGPDEYVVEDILGVQWNPDNKQVEYYIKWEGWDNQYNNWEPESNCECDDLTEQFLSAVEHLKKSFAPKGSARKRAGPRSRTTKTSSDVESDDEPVVKKKPGPKSKTAVTKSRPGPKSRTETPAKTPEPVSKRPGPKSRTSAPGPASAKKPGPKSQTRTPAKDSDDDEEEPEKVEKETRNSRKSNSESDDESGAGDRNGNGTSSRYKKLSDSDNDSDKADSPAAKKRPGPKSRTSSAGPLSSKKRPGPKSRTAAANSDNDDSD